MWAADRFVPGHLFAGQKKKIMRSNEKLDLNLILPQTFCVQQKSANTFDRAKKKKLGEALIDGLYRASTLRICSEFRMLLFIFGSCVFVCESLPFGTRIDIACINFA